MYPGRPVSSWLSTTIESWGISTAFRVSRLIVLWAQATKGTAKKARTINANILFIIYFPPIDKYAGSPSRDRFYGIAHLNPARCSAIVVPAENQKSGQVIPSKSNEMESRRKYTKGSWYQRSGQLYTEECKKSYDLAPRS